MGEKSRRTLAFELPFHVGDPVLVNPQVGIARARRRGGRHSFTMDVTLLDTPDHRLLRAGIVLAHRVVDGLGQWYLDAPGWQPWLPSERTEDMGAAGDLPQEFASLVRPFRRHAALGPVAALTCERASWLLLDEAEAERARVRDDRTSIRQGGVVTARYREVTVQFSKAATRAQREHVTAVMDAIGAAACDEFPSLAERIGAPVTGLSDFRDPSLVERGTTLESFVSWMFARRLDAVMRADLALRSGADDDMDHLRAELAELQREVRSLAFALEPGWRRALEARLETALGGLAGRTIHQLGDDYLAVLDALVLAVRAPKLGDASGHQVADVLRDQTFNGATILVDRARSLTLSSGNDRWAAALASARQMKAVAHTTRLVMGKKAKKFEELLDEVLDLLVAAQVPPGAEEPNINLDWDAVVAFQEGRRFERALARCQHSREAFLDAWPELEHKMFALRRKVGR